MSRPSLRPAGVATLAIAAATLLLGPVAAADTTSFPQQDNRQDFEVPAGVCTITVVASGGQGGLATGPSFVASGGLGGRVTTTIPVTPGEHLGIFVGAEGSGTTGGFVGGGAGGGGVDSGAGGGGASEVGQIAGGTGCPPCVTPTPGTGTEAAVVVAAGGGGAGGGNAAIGPGTGGAGGGPAGGSGDGTDGDGTGPGPGGDAAAGGGTGGNGVLGGGGGGGGGATVGGGGGGSTLGGGGGGGGGSSAVTAPGATGTSFAAGVREDDGTVVFTWTVTGLPPCNPATPTAAIAVSAAADFTG